MDLINIIKQNQLGMTTLNNEDTIVCFKTANGKRLIIRDLDDTYFSISSSLRKVEGNFKSRYDLILSYFLVEDSVKIDDIRLFNKQTGYIQAFEYLNS